MCGQPRPDSVPHRVAVQNRKTLLSSAESKEGLAKQIAMFQEKVGRLEQEKEHWVLELQLLKIKYDNEQQVGKVVMMMAEVVGEMMMMVVMVMVVMVLVVIVMTVVMMMVMNMITVVVVMKMVVVVIVMMMKVVVMMMMMEEMPA